MNNFLKLNFFFSFFLLINCLFEEEEFNVNHNAHVILLPNYGHLRGGEGRTSWTNQTYYGFLGIPYAKSPSGNLRFKPPVAKLRWNGIWDATKFGRSCPNKNTLDSIADEEREADLEDCLNLCIYTKNLNRKSSVMFYVHGGALKKGAASNLPPNFLLEEDIVLVVVQYRYGALGFASTRSAEIPGNMGILDVIFALEWVQKNIKYFGGDSTKITIFGESAGASIVSVLAVTPKIQTKLFHRIIIQSGSLLSKRYAYKDPINDSKHLCIEFNCKQCTKIDDINNCLKNATLDKLIMANSNKAIPFGFTTFDYENVIPQSKRELVKQSDGKYEIMAGVNKNEGTFLINAKGLNGNPRKYLENIIQDNEDDDLSGTLLNFFSQNYFDGEDLNATEINPEYFLPIITDVISTITIKSPIQQFMELLFIKSSNNFLYTFDYSGQYIYVSYVKLLGKSFKFYPFINGSNHADDLLYLFPWKKNLNKNDTEMAKIMVNLWTSFAINGKPEAQNQIVIPKMKTAIGPYFHINKVICSDNNFLEEFQASKRDIQGYING